MLKKGHDVFKYQNRYLEILYLEDEYELYCEKHPDYFGKRFPILLMTRKEHDQRKSELKKLSLPIDNLHERIFKKTLEVFENCKNKDLKNLW